MAGHLGCGGFDLRKRLDGRTGDTLQDPALRSSDGYVGIQLRKKYPPQRRGDRLGIASHPCQSGESRRSESNRDIACWISAALQL